MCYALIYQESLYLHTNVTDFIGVKFSLESTYLILALQFENFMVENYAFQDGKLMDRWINVLVNAIAVVPFVVR